MRKIINIFIGILILIGAIFMAKKIIANKQKPIVKAEKTIKKVIVQTVKNDSISVLISANGLLKAADRIEIFSEVQGVFNRSSKNFKVGEAYQKGELILGIENAEFYANLLAQKNTFYNLVASIIPDLKIDFPEAYQSWDAYLKAFDINKPIQNLPEITSQKEKLFITSKSVISTYYSVKNAEEHLDKFSLKAPFNGVLTEAFVTKGTLIRSGQQLGEFISTESYELEVAVKKAYSNLLVVGKEVEVTDLNNTKKWKGKIKRINGKIDQNTQTISTFIEVKGTNLKEGDYLVANFKSSSIPSVFEIPRKLLIKNSAVFVVEKGVLKLKKVEPVHFTENTVVFKGLKDGEIILSKPVPSAYEGMLVEY